MTANSHKILVCGDVEGKLTQLFKRVSTVNQKNGPFEMLLCVGEFFGSDESEWLQCRKGNLKVPIPTYILGPVKEETKSYYSDLRGCELTENLVYLGPKGIYPCHNGLNIAYLSGKDRHCSESGKAGAGISFGLSDLKNIEASVSNSPKIDILMTSEWPKEVCSYTQGPEGIDVENVGSLLISHLAYKLRPRYHFVGSEGVFFERLPYRNHEVLKESARNVTRFIALAKVGNSAKRKWLYAFNATPIVHSSKEDLVSQPADVTENPFPKDLIQITEKMYSKDSRSGKSSQYFYDMNDSQDDKNGNGPKRKNNFNYDSEQKRRPPKPTGPCWFCLSSPDVEKHLVVSVGSFSYLALAKGGLVKDHLLIMPIEHFQSTSHLEKECRDEIEKFKTTLREMFKSNGQTVVFFERNYKTQHLQVQVVPLPSKFEPHLKEVFIDISEDSGISLDEVPKYSDIAQLAPPGTPFFYVELPTADKFFHRIRKAFPLNFGRELLACPPLLNIPNRVDWRECKISEELETKYRNEIREKYKTFDFTLDADDDSEDDVDDDDDNVEKDDSD